LIALNAALLLLLALVTFAPGAEAQQRRTRPNGQYVMVDARFQGGSEAAVFIYDASNLEMIAVRWDRSRRQLAGLGFRNIQVDMQGRAQGGR
jgi:hypothetical protein